MTTFLTILIIIVCVLLTLVVLIQNSKGGGLTSGLAGNAQVMGVRKTSDFLEKATWTLAVALIVLSLVINMMGDSSNTTVQDTELREKLNTTTPATQPLTMPGGSTSAPAGGQQPEQAPAPAPAQ